MQLIILILQISFVSALAFNIIPSCHAVSVKRAVKAISGALLSQALWVHQCKAVEITTKSYSNERYHTSVSYPAAWESNAASISGDRTVEVFVDPEDSDTNASLVFTPIPADFNRLSAFGNLRDYMVPKGEDIKTEVISESTKGERYTVEYIVTLPEGITRHVETVFALRPQESVVGLTVQTRQETYEKNKDKMAVIVPSLMIDL
jgi:hypothetical protein